MAPKIFATGTTGYLGGTFLSALLKKHPDWESSITCLVRSATRSTSLQEAYPSLTLVSGTLEDSKIIEDEAAKADIVFHFASCDHVGAAEAIKRGLERDADSRGGKGEIKYWIHTSGTDILLEPEVLSAKKVQGKVDQVKVYDDWEGIKEVTSFSPSHSHRPCDIIPLSISHPGIKTAIICPPLIYGKGSGTGSTRSHQAYELARLTLEGGKGILLPGEEAKSKGKGFWPNIHVNDLTRLYLEVTECAASELAGQESKATWGAEGYYFAVNGVHYWQDVASALAEEARKEGFLESAEVYPFEDGAKVLAVLGPAVWNTGSSCRYERAKKLFGWEPQEGSLMEEVREVIRSEAARAGIEKRS